MSSPALSNAYAASYGLSSRVLVLLSSVRASVLRGNLSFTSAFLDLVPSEIRRLPTSNLFLDPLLPSLPLHLCIMSYFLPPTTSFDAPAASKTTSPSPQKQQAANRSRSSPRVSSLGGWVRSKLPKGKPERGGTVRERGYWEQLGPSDSSSPTRRVTDSHRSRRNQMAGSDHIVSWNTAKDLPSEQPRSVFPHRRAVSAGIDGVLAANTDRKWSWIPRDPTEEQLFVHRDVDFAVTSSSRTEAPVDASHAANRRLSLARRQIETKKEARRQRRSLRESGDYLGVQGINPETGQLDVITPTDSDRSEETAQKIESLRQVLKRSPTSFGKTPSQNEEQLKEMLLKVDMEKMRRHQKDKEILKNANKNIMWRRHTKQWSSVQQPDLSPIVQSTSGSSKLSRSFCRDMLTFHLGKPSQNLLPKADTQHHEGEPVRQHSSSKRLGKLKASLTARVGERTSGSSGTVVRTPHRQSLVGASPAAMELFDNGISFDQSDVSGVGKQDDAGISPTAPPDRDPGRLFALEDDRTMPQSSLETLPALHVTSPGKTTARLDPSPTSPQGMSFLDVRANESDKGTTNRKGVHLKSSIAIDLMRKPAAKLKRSISLIPNNGFSPRQGPKQTLRESSAPALLTTHKSLDLLKHPMRATSGDSESHRSSDESPLRRFRSHLSDLTTKIEGKDSQVGRRQTFSTYALNSMTNLLRAPDGTSQPVPEMDKKALPERMAHLSKQAIQRDMSMLRAQVTNLDCLAPDMLQRQTDQYEEGQAWVEDAIRDITIKGNEVMEESVFTPTTTTTGFDQQTSSSSLTLVTTEGAENIQGIQTRGVQGPVSSKQREMRPRETSVTNCQTNLQSSMQANSVPVEETPVIAITSARQLKATKKRTENLVTMSEPPPLTNKAAARGMCKPPTLTSIQHMNLAAGNVRSQVPAVTVRHGGMKTEMKCNVHKEGVEASACQQSNEKLMMARLDSLSSVRDVGMSRLEGKLETLIACTPGSYPSHLDVEDDTDDRSSNKPVEQSNRCLNRRISIGTYRDSSTWDTLEEFFCSIKFVPRLYWGVVAPVFHHNSDYWQRSSKQQTTWRDGITMVLATPLAIAAIALVI